MAWPKQLRTEFGMLHTLKSCVVRILPSSSTGSTASGESGSGTDPSYVFSGSHCPLVVRLVTEVLNAKYGTTAYNVVEELTRELQV